MSLIIRKLDGSTYNLRDLGVKVVEFEPESLEVINEVNAIDGGYVVTRSTYGVRYINAVLKFIAYDTTDYALMRADLFKLFTTTEPYYLIDESLQGRKWYVKNDGKFSLERNIIAGEFPITWLCVNKYAISEATTATLKEWDVDQWAWDGTITWDDELQYTFNSNTFTVNNLGSATVDPRTDYLKIIVKATSNANLQIKNETTGDIFIYKPALASSNTLTIEGIRTYLNGADVTTSTNFGLITLAPGENIITVTNGIIESASIDFNFLYK